MLMLRFFEDLGFGSTGKLKLGKTCVANCLGESGQLRQK